MTYCEFVLTERAHPFHRAYHDQEYGVPSRDERVLFERLVLEIAQAGLSWEIILKKREGYRRAFEGFDVDRVASYGEADVARLLADPGIVRNRLKIAAAIHNAGVVQRLRTEHGSFADWLDAQGDLTKEEWVRLFKRTFRFTGGEIVGEFLMSLGRLPGRTIQDAPSIGRPRNPAGRRRPSRTASPRAARGRHRPSATWRARRRRSRSILRCAARRGGAGCQG